MRKPNHKTYEMDESNAAKATTVEVIDAMGDPEKDTRAKMMNAVMGAAALEAGKRLEMNLTETEKKMSNGRKDRK